MQGTNIENDYRAAALGNGGTTVVAGEDMFAFAPGGGLFNHDDNWHGLQVSTKVLIFLDHLQQEMMVARLKRKQV